MVLPGQACWEEVCNLFCFSQALQDEVVSQASIYSNLLQLKESLFSVASKDDVKVMKLHLEQLDERWRDLPQIISKRLGFQKKKKKNLLVLRIFKKAEPVK